MEKCIFIVMFAATALSITATITVARQKKKKPVMTFRELYLDNAAANFLFQG